MSKKRIQSLIASLLGLALLIGFAVCAVGTRAEAAPLPELSGENYSLTVLLEYKDGEKASVPIPGAGIALYRVADIRVENGALQYTLSSPFAESGVDFDRMNASASASAAKKLAENRSKDDLTDSAFTNENGQAVFVGLPAGMYLVSQVASENAAADYESIEPYFVMVPEAKTVGERYEWAAQVTSIPKTEIKRKDAPNGGKTPEPNRSSGTRVSPKTGDDNHPEIYAVMALLSAALLLRLALRRKRKG